MNMKSKVVACLFAAQVAILTAEAKSYDCQMFSNGIGDRGLLTIGGLTFTKAVSIDLMPTNAPATNASYTVRCQIVYENASMPRPSSYDELKVVLATGETLNGWLEELVDEQYRGAEFDSLLEEYGAKRFAADANARFRDYVAERLAVLDEKLDLETVTVTIEAEGAFRDELMKRYVELQQEE